MRAGPYEMHLWKAHAGLDIILASTLRNLPLNGIDDRSTNIIDHNVPASASIQTTNQILPVIWQEMNVTQLMTLHRTLILKHLMTTGLPPRLDRHIMKAPEKQLETSTDLSKNTEIWARTHGLHLRVWRLSNLHLGSLKVNLQSRRSMITLQMVLVMRHRLAIAPWIRRRMFFDRWICMAHVYNGSKDKLSMRTARAHYHSSIVTSWTACDIFFGR